VPLVSRPGHQRRAGSAMGAATSSTASAGSAWSRCPSSAGRRLLPVGAGRPAGLGEQPPVPPGV